MAKNNGQFDMVELMMMLERTRFSLSSEPRRRALLQAEQMLREYAQMGKIEHDKLYMRAYVGEAKLPDGTVLEMSCQGIAQGAPIIYCPKTRKWFLLSWEDILTMAVKAGITE